VPVLPAGAWGLGYGALANGLIALVTGSAFIIEPTARYLLSLVWLAIPGTVLAFWMYLALLGRIGADRAAYTAVLSPVIALIISSVVEDFRWSAMTLAGFALVAAGNVLVMRRSARPARAQPEVA